MLSDHAVYVRTQCIIIIILIVSSTNFMDFLVSYYNTTSKKSASKFFDTFMDIISQIVEYLTFHDGSI